DLPSPDHWIATVTARDGPPRSAPRLAAVGAIIRRAIALLAVLSALAVASVAVGPTRLPAADDAPTEAPAGFTGLTNGFTDQAAFDANRAEFEEEARIVSDGDEEGGLGPTFNARSCVACH